MKEAWIVFIVFAFGTVQLCTLVYFLYRYKTNKLDAIIKLTESSGQVNSEVFTILGHQGGPTADLRKGLIWLAVGIPAFIGISLLEGVAPAMIVGGVPTLVGIAYLAVRKYGYLDNNMHSTS